MDKNSNGFQPVPFPGGSQGNGFQPVPFPGTTSVRQSTSSSKSSDATKLKEAENKIVILQRENDELTSEKEQLEKENERLRNLPREKEYVEKVVEKVVEKPVEKVVTKTVTKTVEKPVEKKVPRDIWFPWIIVTTIAFAIGIVFFGLGIRNVVLYDQLFPKIGLGLECGFIVALSLVNAFHFLCDEYFEDDYDGLVPIVLWVGLGLLLAGGAVLSCLVL